MTDVKLRVEVAKRIFGLQRVRISKRKHFDGAVFYGAPAPNNQSNGIVPHYEDEWEWTAELLDWLFRNQWTVILETRSVTLYHPKTSRGVHVGGDLKITICRAALETLATKKTTK